MPAAPASSPLPPRHGEHPGAPARRARPHAAAASVAAALPPALARALWTADQWDNTPGDDDRRHAPRADRAGHPPSAGAALAPTGTAGGAPWPGAAGGAPWPGAAGGAPWPGAAGGTTLASGHAALDAELPGGGWPLGELTELLQAQPGCGEWRLLRPAFAAPVPPASQWAAGRSPAAHTKEAVGARRPRRAGRPAAAGDARPLLLVGAPYALHAPALAAWGLDAARLWRADPPSPAARLWLAEQALAQCSGTLAALWLWLPAATRPEQLRRLQWAARRAADYPVFVFRPLAAAAQPSPAPLRLTLAARGLRQLELQIVKRRGPAQAAPLLLDAPPPGLLALLAPLGSLGAAFDAAAASADGPSPTAVAAGRAGVPPPPAVVIDWPPPRATPGTPPQATPDTSPRSLAAAQPPPPAPTGQATRAAPHAARPAGRGAAPDPAHDDATAADVDRAALAAAG